MCLLCFGIRKNLIRVKICHSPTIFSSFINLLFHENWNFHRDICTFRYSGNSSYSPKFCSHAMYRVSVSKLNTSFRNFASVDIPIYQSRNLQFHGNCTLVGNTIARKFNFLWIAILRSYENLSLKQFIVVAIFYFPWWYKLPFPNLLFILSVIREFQNRHSCQ